jgi:hypothetical protein
MTGVTSVPTEQDARSPSRAGLVLATWRQHRTAIAGLLIMFAAVAIGLIVTGIQTHRAYAIYNQHHCIVTRLPMCHQIVIGPMNASSWALGKLTGTAVLPVLAGIFIGAPLMAREFETGAFRFSLAQGVSIRRQLACKLLVLGTVLAVASAAVGAIVMWDVSPYEHIAVGRYSGLSYWWPAYFNNTVLMLPVWVLLDFGLGVLAGVVIKRLLPAVAAALVAALAAAAGTTGYATSSPTGLYSNLLRVSAMTMRDGPSPFGHTTYNASWPPAVIGTASYPPYPPGSVQVTSWFAGPGGRPLSPKAELQLFNSIPEFVFRSLARTRAWVGARHITAWISYQPADRYWIFQSVLAAILLAVAAAAGFAAVWLAGRRR